MSVKPVFNLIYRFYRLFTRLRDWLWRRFTSPGLGVLAGLVFAGLMGPDLENNITYQAFVALLFLLLVSVGFSVFFRPRFAADRVLPRFGTVGSPFGYRLTVTNRSPRKQQGLTVLEDLAEARPSFSDWLAVQLADEKRLRPFRLSGRRRVSPFKRAHLKTASVPPMLPGESVEVTSELTPLRRGLLRFAGVTIARPDPLGIFRAFKRFPLPQSVLVLPRRYPLPLLALPGTMKYQQGGVALASNVGQSDEFVALRDYRYGDPLRHIHWRSWARVGKPVVREFEDEYFVRHALVLDTFTGQTHTESFEEAVSVAASFACTIQTQESLLDLLFVGTESYCFTAGRGLAHADQLLEVLASVAPCREQAFFSLERLVLDHIKAVSGCICVLLAWDEPRRALVEKLKVLGVPLLVLVILDSAPEHPLDLGPMKDEPEKFRMLEAGKIAEGLARIT